MICQTPPPGSKVMSSQVDELVEKLFGQSRDQLYC